MTRWITDLYTTHLRDFFEGPRNVTAHLIGSRRPLKRLTDEIDGLARYVGAESQEKLAAIKEFDRREGSARFRPCLSRTQQGMAVRACARHIRVDRAGGDARFGRLCVFVGILVMWRPRWPRSVSPESQSAPGARRDRVAMLLGLATVVAWRRPPSYERH